MIAAKIATLRRGDNQHTANAGTSQSDAATLLNVSPDSVGRAATVIRDAAPNVAAAVERGVVSVSAATKAVKAAPKEIQETWSAEDIKKAAKIAEVVPLPTANNRHSDGDHHNSAAAARTDGFVYFLSGARLGLVPRPPGAAERDLLGGTELSISRRRRRRRKRGALEKISSYEALWLTTAARGPAPGETSLTDFYQKRHQRR